ncbi:hypothetical protein Tco_1012869 [Tanacetum coccineum]
MGSLILSSSTEGDDLGSGKLSSKFGEDGGGGGMMVVGGCESICSIYENIYWSSSLNPKMRVRLWIQQRHESPCASSKFQGMGFPMMGVESDEDEVSLVDGVLEGALGALGDDSCSLCDGVIVSLFVKSIKSCFGYMMVNFGFFDGLEMEAFSEAMEVDNG